ncbi:photosystem II repair protein PSB27-H1, chloroplastic-like [Zingiber officinale]|uniref:photosystem II repair protein PSB27-H1, chloroplastic-like n=1 Tax=Zingiber officinale TaxID=94328 RepID=UPI001C4CA2D9|nr:photosystem II repair protein PSB27-H1, chloroplastic-like [Zingiber officinale]
MASSSPFLTPPTSKPSPSLTSLSARPAAAPSSFATANAAPCCARAAILCRRELLAAAILSPTSALLVLPPAPALASDDEEYVKETTEMINKLRSTINMDKQDPNVATAVSELREASNTWVAKYRREKALLGRASFRDIYSALNAVSGHYISFGPTAPIPAKRKARILEEVDTAEKALLRGR